MKVHSKILYYKQNNAHSFGAYYNENPAGHIKKLCREVKDFSRLEKAINLLQEKRPNHKLEILEAKLVRGTEENNRVDWRKATRTMWRYKVRNNENGHSIWINTPERDEHLAQISETLASFSDVSFWRSKKENEKLYNALVKPNNKIVNNRAKTEKVSTITKIKNFLKFWTTSIKK